MSNTKGATAPEFTTETGQDKAVPLAPKPTAAKATKKTADKATTAKAKGTHKAPVKAATKKVDAKKAAPKAKVAPKAKAEPKAKAASKAVGVGKVVTAKGADPVAKKSKVDAEPKKIGGARAGAGRPVAIKDKHRQTVDFTGDHKARINKLAAVKAKATGGSELGLSPFMRELLDEFLPVLEARNGIKTPKTK